MLLISSSCNVSRTVLLGLLPIQVFTRPHYLLERLAIGCLLNIALLLRRPCWCTSHYNVVITSAKEVMFSPGFVCGFVSLFVNKITLNLWTDF